MARGSHHTSGGHRGSHHRSSSHRSSSHRSSSHRSSSHRSSSHRSTSYRSSSYSYRSSGSHYRTGGFSSSGAKKVKTAPQGVFSYNGTWITDNDFYINENDQYFNNNYKKGKEPWPASFPTVYGILLMFLFIFCSTNFIYEMGILFFEAMPMTDGAFFLVDNLIYYGQWFLLIGAVIWGVWGSIRKKTMRRAFCKEMVEYYKQKAQQDQMELQRKMHQATLKYYKECPNCGAPAGENDTVCAYCDSSLLIPDARTFVTPEEGK